MPTGLFFFLLAQQGGIFVYTKNSDVKIHIPTKLSCSSSCSSLVQPQRGPSAQGRPSVPSPAGLLTSTVELTAQGNGGLVAEQHPQF